MHPYMLFIETQLATLKIKFRDAFCLSLLLLFVYFFALPSLLSCSISIAFYTCNIIIPLKLSNQGQQNPDQSTT